LGQEGLGTRNNALDYDGNPDLGFILHQFVISDSTTLLLFGMVALLR